MSTPAGWYDDGSGRQRWWDGERWSEHFAPQIPRDGAPTDSAGAYVPSTQQVAATTQRPEHAAAVGSTFGGEGRAPGSDDGPNSRGLAIAALVVGIIAFLTGLVPVVGLLLGIGAVALGVVALVKRQPKTMAIIAIVLGSLGALSSVIVTSAISTFSESSSQSSAQQPTQDADDEKTDEQPDPPVAEPSQAPEAPEPQQEPEAVEEPGTAANPLPQPYVATGFLGGEKYSLTAKITNSSANAQVEEWNMFNSEAPAGFKYVVVEMTMTGIDPDGVEPSLATLDLYLATGEGNRYDSEFVSFGEGMPSMSDGPTLYPDNAFTGFAAYIVPEASTSFLLYDNANYVTLQ